MSHQYGHNDNPAFLWSIVTTSKSYNHTNARRVADALLEDWLFAASLTTLKELLLIGAHCPLRPRGLHRDRGELLRITDYLRRGGSLLLLLTRLHDERLSWRFNNQHTTARESAAPIRPWQHRQVLTKPPQSGLRVIPAGLRTGPRPIISSS